MRKFALSGLVVSCAWLATLASAETVPQQPTGGTTKVVGDAVVVGDCRLLVINKQDVPSHRSGQLKWLATAELEKQSDGTYRYLDEAKHKEPMPSNREVLIIQVDLRDKEKEPAGRKIL